MAQFQLGSISTGTLRPEDLAPVFIEELLSRGVDAGDVPEDMDGLYNALDNICPPFVYFGTLEGDGADFGFWPNYDGMTEANIDGLDEFQADGVIVEYTGYGGVTVMDLDRNVLWRVV